MEDKQFNKLFDLITRCVTGIRELQDGQKKLEEGQKVLQKDIAELKGDVAELKEGQQRLEEGQSRLEKELQTTNKALDTLAGESVRTKVRVDLLERKSLFNNKFQVAFCLT